jgi:hypothetical protein
VCTSLIMSPFNRRQLLAILLYVRHSFHVTQPYIPPVPLPFCSLAARIPLELNFIQIILWLLRSVKNLLRDGDSRMTERNRMTEIGCSAQMTMEIVLRLKRIIFSRVRNGFGSDVVRNRSYSMQTRTWQSLIVISNARTAVC